MTVRAGLLPERYTGAQPIGRGGMGEIFRATDTSLGRAVAVKVLAERYAQDPSVRERFTREALAVARLSGNPNIVTIYDVGVHEDRPFIVMEYLAGGSLEQKLASDGVQTAGQALEWLEQTAGALDAAHREGVVHRDVKPANLLLDRHGRVHVADFGIASAAGLSSLTQTGTVLGTASYLSPEQAQGERTTAASDLYSLGIVAFELLTGRRPFVGDSVAAEAVAHVTGDVPSVREMNPALPLELDAVFARALAKDPAERFTSGAEFVAALRQSLEDAAGATGIVAPVTVPLAAAAPTRAYARQRARRSRLTPVIVLLVLLGIGGAITGVLLAGGSGKPAATPPTTAAPPTTAPPPTTTPPPVTTAPPPSDPTALNNQAYVYMTQHNFQAALPLLQQAVQQLQGQSSITAGYANYNLGVTLIALGRCADAVPYLQTARQIEPGRHEVHDALKAAQRCGGGDGNGNGAGGD
jgi:serine/threonine-protein kinase